MGARWPGVLVAVVLAGSPAWAQRPDLVQRAPVARPNPQMAPRADTGPLWAEAGRAQRAYVEALRRATDAEIAAQRGRGAVDADLLALKNELDSMSEMNETDALRLQMMMDRLSRMMTTLSNILKKQSETSSTITQNLK